MTSWVISPSDCGCGSTARPPLAADRDAAPIAFTAAYHRERRPRNDADVSLRPPTGRMIRAGLETATGLNYLVRWVRRGRDGPRRAAHAIRVPRFSRGLRR